MQTTTSRLTSAFSSAAEKFSNCGKLVLVIYVCFGILYIAASPSVLIKSHGILDKYNNNYMKQIQDENKKNTDPRIILRRKEELNFLNIFKQNNNNQHTFRSSQLSEKLHSKRDIDHVSAINIKPLKSQLRNNRKDLSLKTLKSLDKLYSSITNFGGSNLPAKNDQSHHKLMRKSDLVNKQKKQNNPQRNKTREQNSNKIFQSEFTTSSSISSYIPELVKSSSKTQHER